MSISGDETKGRLEGCEIWGHKESCVSIVDGADPMLVTNAIHDGKSYGVLISRSKGRLEGNQIWGNMDCGVIVTNEGDPTIAGCTIRDHAGVGDEDSSEPSKGCGVYVCDSAPGRATIQPDCVFARNVGGDVVGFTR